MRTSLNVKGSSPHTEEKKKKKKRKEKTRKRCVCVFLFFVFFVCLFVFVCVFLGGGVVESFWDIIRVFRFVLDHRLSSR